MDTPKVFESEYRFCLILWEHEPIKSSELVKLCKEQLGWKPTTTYTVIKRLSERGVVQNDHTVVTSLVSKDQVQAAEIQEMVDKTFEGSLPAFIAAFTKHQKISDAELDAVQEMIDRYRKGGTHERAFLGHFEQEHLRGLDRPGGAGAAADPPQGPRLEPGAPLGPGGSASCLPLLRGERVKPAAQRGNHQHPRSHRAGPFGEHRGTPSGWDAQPILGESLAPHVGDSVNPLQVLVPVLAVLWLAGGSALLAYGAIRYVALAARCPQRCGCGARSIRRNG